jgi:SAM-dependent methyltransferase
MPEDLGRAGQFSELRQLLETAEYSEAAVCKRFGLERFADFEIDGDKRSQVAEPSAPADLLIRIFLTGEYTDYGLAEKLLGTDGAALLVSMGLLEQDEDGRSHGTVALYPMKGLFIASDRWSNPDGSHMQAPADAVYPAIVPNTQIFLDLLPWTGCDSFLDLCAGTGIAALLAARNGAKGAFAGDIADRSTRFAEFNRALNGMPNVSAVTSDLYEKFEGQTFDRIVAHPPYVPTLSPKWIFFSGGEDGEHVTKRIVEGLPLHLADGGTFCCLTMGSDRKGSPFESRLREWLGDAGPQFDVALIVRKTLDPENFALRANPLEVRGADEVKSWRSLFRRLELESLVYGLVIIRRRTSALRTYTVRRQANSDTGRADWEWLLAWESAATGPDLTRLILESRLHASRRTELEVLHGLQEGGWAPRSFELRTDRPFRMACQAQAWMANLIALCDGESTGQQLLQVLEENGALAPNSDKAEFAEAVAALASGGFVEVDGFRPPQAVK